MKRKSSSRKTVTFAIPLLAVVLLLLINTAMHSPYASLFFLSGSTCGNGVLESGEQCDDGNRVSGEGCSTDCTVEPGFSCVGLTSVCHQVLGLVCTEITASNSSSSGPTHNAPPDSAVLTKENFTYVGAIRLTTGLSTAGLAYRPSTNTWFTIGRGGLPPYNLLEYSLEAPSHPDKLTDLPKPTLVKDWGPLNINNVLGLGNQPNPYMKGIYWDEKEQKLWFTYGSWYAVNQNNPVIGYAKLDADGLHVFGPWCVSKETNSDNVKGMIAEAPPELQAITNQRMMMFGIRTNGQQLQSLGVGLVSVAEPSATLTPGSSLNCPVESQTDSHLLVHWPMKQTTFEGAQVYYSDFPTPSLAKKIRIIGNDLVGKFLAGTAQGGTSTSITLASTVDTSIPSYAAYNYTLVGPANATSLTGSGNKYVTIDDGASYHKIIGWDNKTKIATVDPPFSGTLPASGTKYTIMIGSHQNNIFLDESSSVFGKWDVNDSMYQGAWVTLRDATGKITKEGIVYFGALANGYTWYGTQDAHNDPTEDGQTYNNNLPSYVFPGEKVFDTLIGKGYHAETTVASWFIVDPKSVYQTAKKVVAGTAQPEDLQIPWTSAGELHTLGGSPILRERQIGNRTLDGFSLSDTIFIPDATDPSKGKLYLLTPGGNNGQSDEVSTIQVWNVQ